mgnify:CR=1 FL=1
MFRRTFTLVATASALALSAAAYEDPVADEIQGRMMEQQQQQMNDMVAAQQAWGAEEDEDYAYEEEPSYSEAEWLDIAAEAEELLEKRVYGMRPQDWLELDKARFARWLDDAAQPAARMLARLRGFESGVPRDFLPWLGGH